MSLLFPNLLRWINKKAPKHVLENDQLRQGIKEYSEWPTIPQLYVKKEFIGGCDIVKEIYENGELKKIFDEKGVNYNKWNNSYIKF